MKKIYFLLCLLLLSNSIVTFGQLAVFYEGFATEEAFNGWISTHESSVTSRDWTRVDESKGLGKPAPAPVGELWGVGIPGGTTAPFDSWLIRRQAAHLTSDKIYTILFYSKSSMNSKANIEVFIGKSSNISDLKKLNPIIQQPIGSGWINPYLAYYKPDADGDYYFGFRGYSTETADRFLVLDEIEVAVSDAGVTAITAPTDGVNLSSACEVTVTVKNFGGRILTNIPITYTINGGTAIATETVPGPVAVGEEISYTFIAKANLSAKGDYVIKAYTLLPGDTDPTNDATTVTVRNSDAPAPVYDAGVTAITAPVSGTDLPGDAAVTVTVKNFSTDPLSNIPVTYTINGGAPVATETVPGPVQSNAEVSYTFTAKANLSVPGDYVITAYTLLTGDTDPANDAITVTVTHTPPAPVYDAGVTAITAPVSAYNLPGDAVVTVKVKNFSATPLSNIPVTYTVNRGAPVATETIPGPVQSNAEVSYTFTAKANLSTIGDYVIKAYTLLTGDADITNDTTTVTVRHKDKAGISSVNGNLSVYPTLSKGKITVNTAGKATVRILDLSGKMMATYESNAVLDIELPYENGIYFVMIGSEKDRVVFKVILKK